ncbi:kinase-like domain-containing protein [Podospora fimiseda]|uniref:Kinase-like domain-containing protein n=1 Tax=Podospora fimiseda TaxID=252190 RepID=A0AAN7BIP2_9PEZI|nr:kinase-like domain-containing protein [Podospora fimiseda]
MGTCVVRLPIIFNSTTDLLGQGNAGQVFRVRLPGNRIFALKRFLPSLDRTDFDNEARVLEELEDNPHPCISLPIQSWLEVDSAYIRFPLAETDLFKLIRTTAPPANILTTDENADRFFGRHLAGLCEALRYVHEARIGRQQRRRIGFHHDIKPANISIFPGGVWKLSDFVSGDIRFVGANEEIYNRRPSTWDRLYSAPEFVIEGRVSCPTDIWSLGAVFLEVLVWATLGGDAVQQFHDKRREYGGGRATFWSQDEAVPCLNPTVLKAMENLEARCVGLRPLTVLAEIIRKVLVVDVKDRWTAVKICDYRS